VAASPNTSPPRQPSSLTLHWHDSIARIELTSNDGLPRLEVTLLVALREQLASLFQSSDCAGIVLHGQEQCFAAGADLEQVGKLNSIEALEFARRGQRLFQCIARSPKPVVAAISGYCMGGAWDLALACHYRLSTPDAVFRHPGPTVGILTGWGGTQRLPRMAGPARAYEILLEGKTILANRALELGLVDEIVPGKKLLDRALDFALERTRTIPPHSKCLVT
jgi:enoyl-CoA hydratase/carnithine racemase